MPMRWSDLVKATRVYKLWPWCGAPVMVGKSSLTCLRRPRHLGKHVRGAVAAWLADRHAATSGYRRLRRKRGYAICPSKRVPTRRFAQSGEGERGDSNPRIPESQSGALTNLATPTESWERND